MSLVICFDCRATLLPNFHERNKKDRNPSRHRGEAKGEEIRNEIGGCGVRFLLERNVYYS